MKTFISQLTARIFLPLIAFLSVIVLLRGHNQPGGGFIGGLMLGLGIIYYAIAVSFEGAISYMRYHPLQYIGVGLASAIVSGFFGVFGGKPFMTGMWTNLTPFQMVEIKLGTPLLFDIGVYLTVFGVFTLIMLTIAERLKWK